MVSDGGGFGRRRGKDRERWKRHFAMISKAVKRGNGGCAMKVSFFGIVCKLSRGSKRVV